MIRVKRKSDGHEIIMDDSYRSFYEAKPDEFYVETYIPPEERKEMIEVDPRTEKVVRASTGDVVKLPKKGKRPKKQKGVAEPIIEEQ